jgi:hypothetical protein
MNEQKMLIQPPLTLDVLDNHGGFTAEIVSPKNGTNTLWRPGSILKKKMHGTTGTLQRYDRNSFYQTNNNVTIAYYKVPGYRYPVVCWFDNQTNKRIA